MRKINKTITLTSEEIKEIHNRGNLTPEEKVKEWEADEACPLGDAADGAVHRCDNFGHDCHACLTDYANSKKEWNPSKVPKIVARGYLG